jgi:hypothetical protein
MSKANRDAITQHLREAYGGKGGVYCTLLDARHVSAQARRRYFWTSFPVTPLEGDGPRFADILESVEHVLHGCDIGERTTRRMGEVVPQRGITRWAWGMCFSDTAHDKARTAADKFLMVRNAKPDGVDAAAAAASFYAAAGLAA